MTAKHASFKQLNCQPPAKQQGAALLIALVIMTIAIGIAANIMFRQQLHTRLASNISNLEQAYPYATALEDWSRTILSRDFEDSPKTDNLTEAWATKVPPIPIPGGTMSGRLFDLQAKLNLNNLLPSEIRKEENLPKDPAEGESQLTLEQIKLREDYNRYVIAKERTNRLIATIDTEETMGPAENFSDKVEDWIDEDSETSRGGAESDYYQSQDPAYNTANNLLVSVTELRLLKDIDTDAYKLINEQLTALPVPEYTAVNVNTASFEVIQALGFTAEAAENFISVRDREPFSSLEDFLIHPLVSAATESDPPEVFEQGLSVTSNYFLMQGEVNIGAARLYINSILHRNNGIVTVISRDFSNQQIEENIEPEE